VTLITGGGLEKVFLIGGFAEAIGPAHVRIVGELAEGFCQYPVLQGKLGGMIEGVAASNETCLRGAAFFARTVMGPS